jgi:tetratricopeptide (TPR) repeat protein
MKYQHISLLLIVVFSVVLYSNVYKHNYVFDDKSAIVENTLVHKGINGIGEIFKTTLWKGSKDYKNVAIYSYRPIPTATFAIEYEFFGLNSYISHSIQVIFYTILCALVFLVLSQLFKDKPHLPLLIALLFTAHPIHTEVVCNLKSRDELLSLLFAVLSLYCLTLYLDKGKSIAYAFALLSYFCSLLSKETSVCFLGIIPLSLYSFYNQSFKQIAYLMLGYLAIFGVFLGIRAWVLANEPAPFVPITIIQNPLLLAEGFSQVNGTKLYILGKYLQLMILPYNLTFSYFYNDIPILPLWSWQAVLALVAYLGMLYYVYKHFKVKDVIAYGILCYLGGIFLFSHLVIPFGNAMGERLAFTASLGYCIALGSLFYQYLPSSAKIENLQSFVNRTFSSKYATVFGVLILTLTLYSFKTHNRNRAWHSDITLKETDVRTSPNSYFINIDFAMMHYLKVRQYPQEKESLNKALYFFSKANELAPYQVTLWEKHELMHLYNNDLNKAEQFFQKAIEVYNYEITHKDRIEFNAQELKEMEDKWEDWYASSANIFYPSIFYLYRQIGVNYLLVGKIQQAIAYLTEALKSPKQDKLRAMTLRDLAAIYAGQREYAKVITLLAESLSIEPNNYYANNLIAVAHYQLKNYQEAGQFFEKAFTISPSKEVAKNLILFYTNTNNVEKVEYYTQQLNNLK